MNTKQKEEKVKVSGNLRVQMSGSYAISIAFFITFLASMGLCAVSVSHLFDGEVVGATSNWVGFAFGLAFAMIFLFLAVIFYRRATNSTTSAVPVTILLTSGKKINVSGRNFSFSLQWTSTSALWGIFFRDWSAGGLTWVGWLCFGLTFAFTVVFVYGTLRIMASKRRDAEESVSAT